MSEQETLARVHDDLAAGRVALARQRLRGLVGSYPQRLDLREELAELYRRDGVLSQAGRWTFLSETRNPAELRAFDGKTRIRFIGSVARPTEERRFTSPGPKAPTGRPL
ncbi:hypothetical protein OO014_13450 [Intrasporangium calvum]|uniref:Uncharacterized protein n=1 Tax=Intrasporangium calvum TaxID=53358 RepID=A0ABT5GJ35_9MICO|nr:DUF6584 family protein [Intrasporangium calvum]MDC5698264.1 hypothetical protein [Intrasporangium calvum]